MSSRLNVKPRTIFCKDNLDVLREINSNTIDLIYLDPPFNKKKVFTAPVGTSAEGAQFSDIFRQEDIKDEWVKSIEYENPELFSFLNHTKYGGISYNYCYLVYMAIRIIECHRILKDTGSIYLHCDPTMSHYLKVLMDCIFKEKNFRNEIIWSYQGTANPKTHFKKKHDVIFFYARDKDEVFFSADGSSEEISDFSKSKFTKEDKKGKYKEIKHKDGKVYKQYIRDKQRRRDVWEIPIINSMAVERVGYPTQKPVALLERIILASSKDGDVVLDPFCGCATTCVAAEKLNRNWIGIDVSYKAYELVKQRIKKEAQATLFKDEPVFTTTAPKRGEDEDKEIGNVYIISNPAFPNEYKVGIAKNVQSRLNSYQTSDPRRSYKLEYTFKTPHFMEIESHVHEFFHSDHEWVSAKIEDIIREIEIFQP